MCCAELSGSLGIATNNVAEYTRTDRRPAVGGRSTTSRQIAIKGDSLLIIEQMRGNYKVKNEGLRPLLHASAHARDADWRRAVRARAARAQTRKRIAYPMSAWTEIPDP